MIESTGRLKLSEFGARSRDFYETYVRPKLTASDDGKFVAIDSASGDYEIDDDEIAASSRLRTRQPKGRFWIERAGYATAYGRFGQRTRVPL